MDRTRRVRWTSWKLELVGVRPAFGLRRLEDG